MCEMSAVIVLLSYVSIAVAEATNLDGYVQDDTACWRSCTAWPICTFSGGGARRYEGAQRDQEVELTGPVQYLLKPCYPLLQVCTLFTTAACTSVMDFSCCNSKIRSLCVCISICCTCQCAQVFAAQHCLEQANLDSKRLFTH